MRMLVTALQGDGVVGGVSQQAVAGKLTTLGKTRARSVAKIALPFIVLGLLLVAGATPGWAAGGSPSWALKSVALPANFTTEDDARCETETPVQEGSALCDSYVVTVTNVGAGKSSGPVKIVDTLPTGVVAEQDEYAEAHEPGTSSVNEVSCPNLHGLEATTFTCVYEGEVPPEGVLEYRVNVVVHEAAAEAGSITNRVEVVGGGAPAVVSSAPETMSNTVDGPPLAFDLQDFSAGVFGLEGASVVQADSHPATLTTTMDYAAKLDTEFPIDQVPEILHVEAVAEPKTEIVDLPAGLIGNPTVLETCAASAVDETHLHPTKCPSGSLVGYVNVESADGRSEIIDLFNVPPEAGYPAEFGFEFDGTLVMLRPRLLPSKDGYTLSVAVDGVPRSRLVKVTGVRVTFFGVPGERDGVGSGGAFFTDPGDCSGGPLGAHLEMDSWVDPSDWVSGDTSMFESAPGRGVSGCGALRFEPSVLVSPETSETDSPSGFEVVVRVPQSPDVPGVLATPDLRDAVVSLPEGVSVSPGAAYGLVGCQVSGPEGIELGSGDEPFDENRVQEGEEEGPDGLVHPAAGHCPLASQVGEVEVITPLLAEPLKGQVYLAAPECGDSGQESCTESDASDGKLFGIYLEVGSEASGIHVKLRGKVSVNPQTGRVTTSFDEDPQLPFSELRLKLNNGPRAPLATPQSCGTFTTTSDMTPWSTPYTPDAAPSSSFSIASGCNQGFSPSLLAHSTSPAAGAFSPFTLTFARHDGEQDLAGLTVNMPEGLIGKVAGFAQCGNAEVAAAEANTGGCPAASKVGVATAAAGSGSDPFYQSGPVYLTGPYNGAPFGLAVVVPANAGPFHLGNIVVRAAIHINPTTAQVTVVSNPLPQMIDGVPLRVQTVNVTVGQENNFTFNPTNCAGSSVGARISSAQGASVNRSAPFAVTGCAGLPFKPALTAATVGKASKAGGASLDVKIAPSAGQANIAKLDLEIPKQLPSRLTTLQKACVASVFEANPAACPAASDIGSAIVHTPVLSNPLAGPVYLVSHGGEAFPDVELILQGEGVQLVVDGHTQIKNGVTYSHFETIPDAPFTSFETKLPTGKYSIFGSNLPEKANHNFCGQSLSMPVTMTGQNGAVLKQTTKLGVTGCPKVKVASKPKKKKTKAKKSVRHERGRSSRSHD
jgi:hypothetical protein